MDSLINDSCSGPRLDFKILAIRAFRSGSCLRLLYARCLAALLACFRGRPRFFGAGFSMMGAVVMRERVEGD